MRKVIFDFESTGVSPQTDRIVQVGLDVDGKQFGFLINPGVPIPASATNVHGITDEIVAKAKPFSYYAEKLYKIFTGAALIGYNVKRFDIPILIAEFKRCDIEWEPDDQPIIDCMHIFHEHEPRDLAGAVRFYCGREHDDAHDALGDVKATAAVFHEQWSCYYPDEGIADIAAMLDSDGLGWDGKLKLNDGGDVIVTFGKHRLKTLTEIVRQDRGWLEWALGANVFCKKARQKVLEVLG